MGHQISFDYPFPSLYEVIRILRFFNSASPPIISGGCLPIVGSGGYETEGCSMGPSGDQECDLTGYLEFDE
jgi:hypothetical protein